MGVKGIRGAGLGVVLALVGCNHLPDDGRYALTAEEVFTDGCGLTGATPFLRGELRRSGDLILMPLDSFHNIELRGYHLSRSDHFALDGTAQQVSTPVAGLDCLVDWVGVHLEGDPDGASRFRGGLRIEYRSEMVEACRCAVEVDYLGELE